MNKVNIMQEKTQSNGFANSENIKFVKIAKNTTKVFCDGTFKNEPHNIDSKHPKVYLKFNKAANFQSLAICPYCGTHFVYE